MANTISPEVLCINSFLIFPLTDVCRMKQDEGSCTNYVLSWYYNIQQNECIQFWFGGCGGNKNRFDTQKDCEALCLRDI